MARKRLVNANNKSVMAGNNREGVEMSSIIERIYTL
jgi:hypothetical protein